MLAAIDRDQLPRLLAYLQSAGLAVTGIDVDGHVTPPALQAEAVPIIAAFDSSRSTHAAWLTAQERAASAARLDADPALRAIIGALHKEIESLKQQLANQVDGKPPEKIPSKTVAELIADAKTEINSDKVAELHVAR